MALAALVAAGLRAQGEAGPLTPPAPLTIPAPARPTPAANALTLIAAQRAQEMGFPSAAAALYRQLLDTPGADRNAAAEGLATALLDEGQGLEAEKALNLVTGPHSAAWHLRKGLAAAEQGELTTARNERDESKFDQLPPGDRSWHLFLQGTIATMQKEQDKAKDLFSQAANAAVSAIARARFQLKAEQAHLRSSGGPAITEADLEATKKNVEQYMGRKIGYDLARTYAAMLDASGHQRTAIAVLQRQLMGLPAEEREEFDEMHLLLGLIAGANDGAGRHALEQLLERGTDRDKQRIALQLLANASTQEPQLSVFRKELDTLIAQTPPHPILEDLLLFRAQVALATARTDKTAESYARAEDDARALLEKFPGSSLKANAYGVLTASAWEQRRYRTAADDAGKARAELPPGAERAALGVLIAEAWFRARDYRSAADAYAAALREPPSGVTTGDLMFQRVDAEIEAGSLDTAAAVLDELARDPAFDRENRWKAEWNLARALEAHGKTAEAYARVTRLLEQGGGAGDSAKPAAVLPADLRARMAWLQARLASEAGQPEQTLKLADALAGSLAGVPPELRTEIASSAALLRGEAYFALGRDAQALAVLAKLRTDFPRSDAAVYSYFDEAEHDAKQDNTVEAQRLLIKLADDFPDNAYAPFALFQAALQAERLGQDANLIQANQLIEDLVKKYPESELVFAARLKQADLLRKLNQFPQAQQAYEALVNRYPQRPDIALAQLALAETHSAQAATEPSHVESALVLFEHVRDRVDAPIDARVEAGFNLGWLLARRGESVKAEEAWWRDVVTAFLLDPAKARQLGDRGRYWMTRTLLELGALYERQEKLEQAKEAWLLILKAKLGYGEALAKARLARFGLAETGSGGEAKPAAATGTANANAR